MVDSDWRMLRYMAGITWRNRVSSDEVTKCGLKEVNTVLKVRSWRWFGHVKKRGDGESLGRAVGVEVPGSLPPSRSRKTCR